MDPLSSSPTSSSPGLYLPDELLESIFLLLDPVSLFRVASSSRQLRRAAVNPRLWERLYHQRWTRADAAKEAERHRLYGGEVEGAGEASHLGVRRKRRVRRREDVDMYAPSPPHRSRPDYYSMYAARLAIDADVLARLQSLVNDPIGRIARVEELVAVHGDDAWDMLQRVQRAQQTPTWEQGALEQEAALEWGVPWTLGVDVEGRDIEQGSSRRGVGARRGSTSATREPTSQMGILPLTTAPARRASSGSHRPTTISPTTPLSVPVACHHLFPVSRSPTKHLALRHHAGEVIEHMARRKAIQGLRLIKEEQMRGMHPEWGNQRGFNVDRIGKDGMSTEEAMSYLNAFRDVPSWEVSDALDVLADLCSEWLDQQNVSRNDPFALTQGIRFFLMACGWRGAEGAEYYDLDNHFLTFTLTSNRCTLPLSLSLVFCAVAERLGIDANTIMFPRRMLCVIVGFEDGREVILGDQDMSSGMTSPASSPSLSSTIQLSNGNSIGTRSPSENAPPSPFPFYLDIFGTPNPLSLDEVTSIMHQLHVHVSNMIVSTTPAPAPEMVLRAARNIFNSVHRQQHAAEEANRTLHGDRGAYEKQWDENLLSSFLPSFVGGGSEGTETEAEEKARKRWQRWTPSQRAAALVLAKEPPPRQKRWTERDQQASIYAGASGFLRLSSELDTRMRTSVASIVEGFFPLDVSLLKEDFADRIWPPTRYLHPLVDGAFFGHPYELIPVEPWMTLPQPTPENPTPLLNTPGLLPGAPAETEAEKALRMEVARICQDIRQRDETPPTPKRRTGLKGEKVPRYRVGQVFRDRSYGYTAVIYGWHEHCDMSEHLIQSMHIDSLEPRGREQPFYDALVDDGSKRYVPQMDIIISDPLDEGPRNELDVKGLMELREIGKWFRAYDEKNGEFVPSADLLAVYPDR